MVSESIIEVQFSFDYIIQTRKKFSIEPSVLLCNGFSSLNGYEQVFFAVSCNLNITKGLSRTENSYHWLCCMNKNTLRMTFAAWRATYFETEVYMQVCIQNYILSPLFIRVKIDFNLTLTQSFDSIIWLLERQYDPVRLNHLCKEYTLWLDSHFHGACGNEINILCLKSYINSTYRRSPPFYLFKIYILYEDFWPRLCLEVKSWNDSNNDANLCSPLNFDLMVWTLKIIWVLMDNTYLTQILWLTY